MLAGEEAATASEEGSTTDITGPGGPWGVAVTTVLVESVHVCWCWSVVFVVVFVAIDDTLSLLDIGRSSSLSESMTMGEDSRFIAPPPPPPPSRATAGAAAIDPRPAGEEDKDKETDADADADADADTDDSRSAAAAVAAARAFLSTITAAVSCFRQ